MRSRTALVFALLGLIIPIPLFFLISHVDREPRAHPELGLALWRVLPYLWPSAGALIPIRQGDVLGAIVFWTMSLALNAGLYWLAGLGVSWILTLIRSPRALPPPII